MFPKAQGSGVTARKQPDLPLDAPPPKFRSFFFEISLFRIFSLY